MSSTFDNIAKSRTLTHILRAVGLWPLEPKSGEPSQQHEKFFERSHRYLLQLPIAFSYTLLMWLEALTSDDLKHTTDVLYIALTETALLVKIISIWYYASVAVQLLHAAQHNVAFTLRNVGERTMWQRAQRRFGIVALLYIFMSLSFVCCKVLSVLFMERYEMPFYYWTPFEWRDPRYYWYAYLYGVVAMFVTCLSNTTLDMTYCYMMFHLALLYQLVGVRMQQVGRRRECYEVACEEEEEEKNSEELLENDAQIHAELRRIAMMHQQLKSLCHQCESIVSAPVLAQILLSSFVLCFSIYRLQNVIFPHSVSIVTNASEFYALLQYAAVMTLQIFLPCYYANEVTLHSHHLTNFMYNSNWIQLAPHNRRFVLLYMEYMKLPVVFRAGGFFDVGLPIFTKTINNAYSLLALLLNMTIE